jgi:hypothetical protein
MTLEDSISDSGTWRVVGLELLCLEIESMFLFLLILFVLMRGCRNYSINQRMLYVLRFEKLWMGTDGLFNT